MLADDGQQMTPTVPASGTAAALRAAVDSAVPRLTSVGNVRSARYAAPGKWSPREIIGHLIDSAQNNHGRFVRAQLSPDLVFPGYAQDDWVRLQGYSECDWGELIALWASYNRHLVHVIGRVSADAADRPRRAHNLDEIAWHSVPPDASTTLAFFMADYVTHLEHHLQQIWDATGA
ncbi:hypothetical protein BH11GEM2_BH11GEM2_25910 [soil metagenome]